MSGQTPYSLTQASRIVIKIGSALLVDATGTLRLGWLEALCEDIAQLKAHGVDIVIVSSGAIGLGRKRLGLGDKTLTLTEKQACAAAGQAHLTQSYEDVLAPHKIVTAQALLTLMDTEDRRRWLNARATLETLLELGSIPVINENDTVSTAEIRYGDNDRLAARVAQMVSADVLVLLSDIDGLYTADPRTDKTAAHIPHITEITPDILAMGGEPNAEAGLGSGGMATKLVAANIATQAGCRMVITKGDVTRPLSALTKGAKASWFEPVTDPKAARKQWILGSLSPSGETCGKFTVDAGAANALSAGNSLLPAGVTHVDGSFEKGDIVEVIDSNGALLARGLTAYSAGEAQRIIGLKSNDIATVLGYTRADVLIHRDDLVMAVN